MADPDPPGAEHDGAAEPPETQTFESALARLDAIVRRMDAEDVGLEEALRLFEEGHRYLAICRERLARAQRRIEELTLAEEEAEPGANGPPADGTEPGPAAAP